mmetsp:Transcript_30198/g.68319  ORF Transcript_30198/g.68319 Transcript_30198/m.68319 type:complete len:202 (-) Transcript_30198:533-1138(-)
MNGNRDGERELLGDCLRGRDSSHRALHVARVRLADLILDVRLRMPDPVLRTLRDLSKAEGLRRSPPANVHPSHLLRRGSCRTSRSSFLRGDRRGVKELHLGLCWGCSWTHRSSWWDPSWHASGRHGDGVSRASWGGLSSLVGLRAIPLVVPCASFWICEALRHSASSWIPSGGRGHASGGRGQHASRRRPLVGHRRETRGS